MRVMLVVVVANALATFILTPHWGAVGAAFGLLVSQSVLCIVGVYALYGRWGFSEDAAHLVGAGAILAGLLAVLWLVRASAWWFIWMGLGWAGAVAGMVMLRILDLSEIRRCLGSDVVLGAE
jgi:hypothetical protein